MTDDPIKHVIVLMLENRSFDQMLGCFREKYHDLVGVDPDHPRENRDELGRPYRQQPTQERQMVLALDPQHEVEHVGRQINHGAMDGFVRDFAIVHRASVAEPAQFERCCQYIMDYYPRGFLPGLHFLAEHFTICDNWFSSVPGPTWTNRFFALSGTANGRVNMPGDETHHWDLPGFFQQDQNTIFDRLNAAEIPWKVYFHDIAQSWVLRHQRWSKNVAGYFYIDEFFEDVRGDEDDFPDFCLIEPDYFGFRENDDHPPHDVMKAEKFIVDVYNALRSNPKLWDSTLLVVFFDEHGGFFDHVPPPAAPEPDAHREEFTFDRLGPRVPALLVSRFAAAGVNHTQFDHTSVLRYLTDKWRLGPLGLRTASAASIGVAIGPTPRSVAEMDAIRRIDLDPGYLVPPDPKLEEDAAMMKSAHHHALTALAVFLSASGRAANFDEDTNLPHLPRGLLIILLPSIEMITVAVEVARRSICKLLRGLFARESRPRASLVRPDRLHLSFVTERDDAAKFLMRQKERAVLKLKATLGETTEAALTEATEGTRPHRDSVRRRLAALTGRPFHRYDRSHVEKWLDTHSR